MRPGKPSSAKFESLGSFLTKRVNGSNVSADKGYAYICMRAVWGPYRDGPVSGENTSHLCRLRIVGVFPTVPIRSSQSGFRYWGLWVGVRRLWKGRSSSVCGEGFGFYLTECIHLLVLESQTPHKIVNLLFTITN